MFLLEAEPKRRVDATLVSRIGCSKPTKAAGRRRRLTKQQRSQVADRIGEVRVVQNVLEVQRERQIVTASAATARTTEATTASAWSTKPTTTATATTARSAAAWTTRTSPGHTAAHHRAVTSIALLITLAALAALLTILRVRATAFRAEAPRLTHAQVNARRSRTFTEVARNHHVARRKRQLEVAVRRTLDIDRVRTIRTRGRKSRTLGIERIAVDIASERDIERAS